MVKLKYQNTGEYDLEIIKYFLDIFLDGESPEEPSDKLLFSTDFLDFCLLAAKELATKKPVKEFLRKCEDQRDKQEGRYQDFQARCLLSTLCNIERARRRKERGYKYG